MAYCGTLDVYYIGGNIQYQQLGFGTVTTFNNWLSGTMIPKAQEMIDNYVGHNFSSNSGTITLDGNGDEALPITRIGLVDGSPPRLLPLPLMTVTSVTIDGEANVSTGCQVYEDFVTYEDNHFHPGRQNVEIEGTWGYSSIPHDIQYCTAQICVNFLKEAIRSRMMPDMIAASITGVQPVDERGIVGVLRSPKVLTVNEREILDRYRYKEIEVA